MVGPLDIPMRGVAQTLINTFVKDSRLFTRNETTYVPETGVETPSAPITAQIVTGPPAPFDDDQIDGNSVRKGDLQVVIAQLDLEAANFDVFPSTEARVLVDVNGKRYKVVTVESFVSGDLTAAVRLQLRR